MPAFEQVDQYQRRLFALALNRRYLRVANPQRISGVRKLEASFTHWLDASRGSKRLLTVQ